METLHTHWSALKAEICHYTNFVVSDGTVGCYDHNLDKFSFIKTLFLIHVVTVISLSGRFYARRNNAPIKNADTFF